MILQTDLDKLISNSKSKGFQIISERQFILCLRIVEDRVKLLNAEIIDKKFISKQISSSYISRKLNKGLLALLKKDIDNATTQLTCYVQYAEEMREIYYDHALKEELE